MKKLFYLVYIVFMALAPLAMWWAMFEHYNRDLGNFTTLEFVFLWGMLFVGAIASKVGHIGYKEWREKKKKLEEMEKSMRSRHELEAERSARHRALMRWNSYIKFVRSNADMDRPE